MTHAPRPDRTAEMDAFLARIGLESASHRPLAGDASFRRYARVTHADRQTVLMDAPPPWEDVRPFIAITELLAQCGVVVPEILAQDVEEGFLLLQDLGDLSFTRLLRDAPERERELYLAATEALLAIHVASRSFSARFSTLLKPYDRETYLREVALFSDWFLPQIHGRSGAQALRGDYLARWEAVIETAHLKQNCLVHRDYHADNLFWMEGARGHHAVGMLDYQDALWGDAAYDLASLLEDARRDVGDTTVADCFARFSTAIGEEAQAFAKRYGVVAAQRNAKIIGIFTRLTVRDGKPQYLDYLPRVWGHFMGDLRHPALASIRAFVEAHVPEEWRGRFEANPAIGGL